MIVDTEYGKMHVRLERPQDDKLAQAIANGLRHWASNSSSSTESPTPSAPSDPPSSDEPQNS